MPARCHTFIQIIAVMGCSFEVRVAGWKLMTSTQRISIPLSCCQVEFLVGQLPFLLQMVAALGGGVDSGKAADKMPDITRA